MTTLEELEASWSIHIWSVQFSSVQSFSRVRLFATPWIAARQASLSITNSQSSLRLMSIKLVMLSSHLILCRPLFLLSPIPSSIRVFSNESTLRMRWPKYWSFSFSIISSKKHPYLINHLTVPLRLLDHEAHVSGQKHQTRSLYDSPLNCRTCGWSYGKQYDVSSKSYN